MNFKGFPYQIIDHIDIQGITVYIHFNSGNIMQATAPLKQNKLSIRQYMEQGVYLEEHKPREKLIARQGNSLPKDWLIEKHTMLGSRELVWNLEEED